MRHHSSSSVFGSPSVLNRFRRSLSSITLACFCLTSVAPALAGGYVDGNVVLNPAKAINTGAVSITPTFNNDQFNDQLLVGTVNNDPIRTPSTADPVSTVSGNNYHDETDFVIRGRNGLNTVFTRTYNSAPSSTKVDRGMGFGWTHSYLMRLKSNDFGDCPNCTTAQRPLNANSKTSSITYLDERGGEQNYLVDETSFAVTAPKGTYDTLALDTPSAGLHTLTFRNGVKYTFETPTGILKSMPNVVARLKYIDNAWGDRLTLAYDASGRLSTIVDNLGIAGRTGIVFTYDANSRLKDATDWTGRKWSYAYDASGNLQTLTNPLALALTYGYDAPKHLLTSISKPVQRNGTTVQTKFKYYENGRTFQQTNSFDVGDTLDYDLYRKSTRVTDARGYVREYFYDDNGRMTKLVEPDGAVLLFENQADAIRSKKYDALGYATTYSYRADKAFTGASDLFGNVTREQDALTRTVDTGYGPLDQVATTKDKRGTVSTITFGSTISGCDYTNRPKETRLSALSGSSNVLMASQCWNANATLNSSRSYLDATRYVETRLTYEPASNGLNVSQQQTVGMPSGVTITQTATYDTLGRKKTQTFKRRTSPTNAALIDLTTSYDYDALDRVTKVTDSLGNEVLNTFDANGQLMRVTHRYKRADASFDVRDVVTNTFDAADRVKTQTDAEGNTTSFTYDEAGNAIAVTDAQGHTSRIEYDAMNRKTAVIDATSYRTTTKTTLRGDVIAVTNANGEAISFEIDPLGRKTAAIDAKGYRSEFTYDENSNLTCTVDANATANLQPKNALACTESRAYDELNRVTKITDALNGETNFTYDLAGSRLTVKDAENKTWAFAYDDLGRLSSETDHSIRAITYKFDEASNVYEKTNRLGQTTRYSYDNANRIARVDYLADGTAEAYGYDAAGNRASAVNNTVGYAFTFDRLNRLTGKIDGRGKNLAFTFDKVGNILTKTTYQGSTTSYTYNAANRLVMLRNPDYTQVDYQYDPAGRLLSKVSAAGARSTYQYDANGWLAKLTQFDAANTLVSDTSTTRDRAGNILTQVETGPTPGTSTYTLDALYRLSTADYPGTVNDELFTYDKVGNRKTYTKGSLTANANTRYYNYAAASNRLQDIRIGSAAGTLESGFTNDFEGRLTSQSGIGVKTLTWDAKGRIKTVGAETYRYDPMDYRIGRSGGSLGNRDYFLEGEHLESEYSGTTLQAKYFRGSSIDELVAGYLYDTDNKLKPYLFHQDQLTSTTAVTGHNGGTIQSTRYAAFGSSISNTGTSPNHQTYTGREDDKTGLMYYRARYYDPAIGRFISEDPMGFGAGDVNFYQYTANNPINANDPRGNYADVVVDGSNVNITVPIAYTGVGRTDRNVAAYNSGIASAWSGQFGNYKVTTNVQQLSFLQSAYRTVESWFTGVDRQNVINVVPPSALPTAITSNGGVAGVSCQAGGGCEGWWPSKSTMGVALPLIGAHETGHLMRLGHTSEATNIMSPTASGTQVAPSQIEQIISNSNSGWPQLTGQLSFDDYSSALSGGASGGFILYPNKPNSNSMRSVYRK